MAKPEYEFGPTSAVEFTPCNPPVDGLSEAILARDDGSDAVTRILKFEPGTDTSPNGPLRHDFWEEVFIFEGSFVDLRLNRTFRAGDWATRPPGMEHGPWLSSEGAKMFEVRYYQKGRE
ncbi:cupin domain-containing protein [Sinomonas albida]|uniref:cupin domain-containing protein n=1 Tax=Sinomonas albida TaxID=369942 RepID=UPI0010A8F770|nr:cupin domain-containing protein [Sinomonas albida]